MEKKVTETTIVKQADGFAAVNMEDKKVMMDIEKGLYYSLDDIAGCIWDMLKEPKGVLDIVAHLLEAYDVTEEQCIRDILPLLNALYETGILVIVSDQGFE